ncbi:MULTISPECIES: hypothetical protein [unclassified Moraxella]|uniref:hypothetical protein n=1 Tax=unclassified Moraxella TaxID=2685852 RepID=UPI00359E813F
MSNLYENIFENICHREVVANEGIAIGKADQLQEDIQQLNEYLYRLFDTRSINSDIDNHIELLADFVSKKDDGMGSRLVKNGVHEYTVLNYENAQSLYQQMKFISNLLER